MVHITSFCLCLGLETGSKIIGYLHLLLSLGLVGLYSLTSIEAGQMVGTVEDAMDGLYSKVYHITIALAMFTVLHVLLAVTLIYSVHNRSVLGVRVWVWGMYVMLLMSLSYLLYSMTFGFTVSGSHIFLAFLEGIVFFGVLVYCLLCVYSYSLLLRSWEDALTDEQTNYYH